MLTEEIVIPQEFARLFLRLALLYGLPIWCVLGLLGWGGIVLVWRIIASFSRRKAQSPTVAHQDVAFSTRISGPRQTALRLAWGVLLVIAIALSIRGWLWQIDYVSQGSLEGEIIFVNFTDNETVVMAVSETARGYGIRVGDILLNPDVPLQGKTGDLAQLKLVSGQEAPRIVQMPFLPVPSFARIFAYFNLPMQWSIYGYFLPTRIGVFLVFLVVILLLARYRSDDWMAWITALGLVCLSLYTTNLMEDRVLGWVYELMLPGICLMALLFPTGKFAPGKSWLVFMAYLGKQLINIYAGTYNIRGEASAWFAFSFLLDTIFLIIILGIVIYRYRRVFTPVQRLQTKWVILAMAISPAIGNIFGAGALALLLSFVFGYIPLFYFYSVGEIAWLVNILVPVGFAFAIFRYRLYDVDVIINRSLVYTFLTLALLGVFGLQFMALQTAITTLLGGQSAVVAAGISGVVTTTLFRPTRRLARQFVDRRIYKLRYNLDELRQAQYPPEIKNPGALSGRQFGEYVLLDLVGQGGMGEVYQGQAPQNGRLAAIKILPATLSSQKEFQRRFEREAETMALLTHPNIVRFFDSGQVDGSNFLTMEYIDGQSLYSLLKERQRLSLSELLDFFAGVVSAIDYIHALGFVHRDLKPSNIMLRKTKSGKTETVLMDFGVSKGAVEHSALTGSGVVGTIHYMAPEQIRSASDVDYRADLYALGVIVYEALTGKLPFDGNLGQVLFLHLQAPAPDPLHIVTDLPPFASQALQRALNKSPEERFASAKDFFAALEYTK